MGLADSVCSSSDVSSRNLKHDLFLLVCELFFDFRMYSLGPAFLIGISQYVATLQRKQVWQAESIQSKWNFVQCVRSKHSVRYHKEAHIANINDSLMD